MGTQKERLPQFNLRIPPKLRSELEVFCKDQEKTMTNVILDALRFYLDSKK
jgi:hypothetical protein